MKLKIQTTALVFGTFLGGWHILWSLLVMTNLAQPLLNFIFWTHMIANPYQVSGFTLTQSLTLVLITFGIGYVGGGIFAWVWNYFHKK
ncbi:MAG TPA: hypothetical protein VFQ63_00390 [Patescibacteria group bacterium]|nr:hypothetical protein [Patescibacteria group bacterium]